MKKNIAKDTKIVAVIKTDGYGHGAVRIAKQLEDVPYVWGYAVATVEEALKLAEQYVGKDPSYILMPTGSLTVPLLKD